MDDVSEMNFVLILLLLAIFDTVILVILLTHLYFTRRGRITSFETVETDGLKTITKESRDFETQTDKTIEDEVIQEKVEDFEWIGGEVGGKKKNLFESSLAEEIEDSLDTCSLYDTGGLDDECTDSRERFSHGDSILSHQSEEENNGGVDEKTANDNSINTLHESHVLKDYTETDDNHCMGSLEYIEQGTSAGGRYEPDCGGGDDDDDDDDGDDDDDDDFDDDDDDDTKCTRETDKAASSDSTIGVCFETPQNMTYSENSCKTTLDCVPRVNKTFTQNFCVTECNIVEESMISLGLKTDRRTVFTEDACGLMCDDREDSPVNSVGRCKSMAIAKSERHLFCGTERSPFIDVCLKTLLKSGSFSAKGNAMKPLKCTEVHIPHTDNERLEIDTALLSLLCQEWLRNYPLIPPVFWNSRAVEIALQFDSVPSTDHCTDDQPSDVPAIEYSTSTTNHCTDDQPSDVPAIEYSTSTTDHCTDDQPSDVPAIEYSTSTTDHCTDDQPSDVPAIEYSASTTNHCTDDQPSDVPAIEYSASTTDHCTDDQPSDVPAIEYSASTTNHCTDDQPSDVPAIEYSASTTDGYTNISDSQTQTLDGTFGNKRHQTTIVIDLKAPEVTFCTLRTLVGDTTCFDAKKTPEIVDQVNGCHSLIVPNVNRGAETYVQIGDHNTFATPLDEGYDSLGDDRDNITGENNPTNHIGGLDSSRGNGDHSSLDSDLGYGSMGSDTDSLTTENDESVDNSKTTPEPRANDTHIDKTVANRIHDEGHKITVVMNPRDLPYYLQINVHRNKTGSRNEIVSIQIGQCNRIVSKDKRACDYQFCTYTYEYRISKKPDDRFDDINLICFGLLFIRIIPTERLLNRLRTPNTPADLPMVPMTALDSPVSMQNRGTGYIQSTGSLDCDDITDYTIQDFKAVIQTKVDKTYQIKMIIPDIRLSNTVEGLPSVWSNHADKAKGLVDFRFCTGETHFDALRCSTHIHEIARLELDCETNQTTAIDKHVLFNQSENGIAMEIQEHNKMVCIQRGVHSINDGLMQYGCNYSLKLELQPFCINRTINEDKCQNIPGIRSSSDEFLCISRHSAVRAFEVRGRQNEATDLRQPSDVANPIGFPLKTQEAIRNKIGSLECTLDLQLSSNRYPLGTIDVHRRADQPVNKSITKSNSIAILRSSRRRATTHWGLAVQPSTFQRIQHKPTRATKMPMRTLYKRRQSKATRFKSDGGLYQRNTDLSIWSLNPKRTMRPGIYKKSMRIFILHGHVHMLSHVKHRGKSERCCPSKQNVSLCEVMSDEYSDMTCDMLYSWGFLKGLNDISQNAGNKAKRLEPVESKCREKHDKMIKCVPVKDHNGRLDTTGDYGRNDNCKHDTQDNAGIGREADVETQNYGTECQTLAYTGDKKRYSEKKSSKLHASQEQPLGVVVDETIGLPLIENNGIEDMEALNRNKHSVVQNLRQKPKEKFPDHDFTKLPMQDGSDKVLSDRYSEKLKNNNEISQTISQNHGRTLLDANPTTYQTLVLPSDEQHGEKQRDENEVIHTLELKHSERKTETVVIPSPIYNMPIQVHKKDADQTPGQWSYKTLSDNESKFLPIYKPPDTGKYRSKQDDEIQQHKNANTYKRMYIHDKDLSKTDTDTLLVKDLSSNVLGKKEHGQSPPHNHDRGSKYIPFHNQPNDIHDQAVQSVEINRDDMYQIPECDDNMKKLDTNVIHYSVSYPSDGVKGSTARDLHVDEVDKSSAQNHEKTQQITNLFPIPEPSGNRNDQTKRRVEREITAHLKKLPPEELRCLLRCFEINYISFTENGILCQTSNRENVQRKLLNYKNILKDFVVESTRSLEISTGIFITDANDIDIEIRN